MRYHKYRSRCRRKDLCAYIVLRRIIQRPEGRIGDNVVCRSFPEEPASTVRVVSADSETFWSFVVNGIADSDVCRRGSTVCNLYFCRNGSDTIFDIRGCDLCTAVLSLHGFDRQRSVLHHGRYRFRNTSGWKEFVDNFDSDHVVCETVAYQIFADIKSKRGCIRSGFTNLFAVDVDIGILINAVKTQDNRLSVAS